MCKIFPAFTHGNTVKILCLIVTLILSVSVLMVLFPSICFITLYKVNYLQATTSPPINITVTVINSTAFNSTWRIPDVDEHNGLLRRVEIRLIGIDVSTSQTISVSITNINDTSLQTTIITPLEEYVNYSVEFTVFNGAGPSPYSDIIYLRTDEAAPSDTPQNVAAAALSPTSIRVTLDPPPELDQNGPITSYNIYYTGELFNTDTRSETITTNELYPATASESIILTGLDEYNNYTISVRAVNSLGMSAFTTGMIQITDVAAPEEAPQNLATEALSPTSIEVTFNPPPEMNQNGPITSYIISYTGEFFDTAAQSETINFTNPIYPATESESVNLTGLQEYDIYTISVRAVNSVGESGTTVVVVEITDIAVPADSPTLAFQSVTTTSISTMISPPMAIYQNGPIISYEVRIYTSVFNLPVTLTNITLNPVTYPLNEDLDFTAVGLEEFVVYNLTVRAYTLAGPGEFSGGILQQTDPTAPSAAPQNVIAQPLSDTSIRVTLSPPPGIDQNGLITSYNISYAGKELDTELQFLHFSPANPIYPASATESMNLIGLEAYNNYTISVRAINAEGTSVFSNGIIQVTDEGISGAPTILNATSNSPTQVCVGFREAPLIDQNGVIVRYFVNLSSPEIAGQNYMECDVTDISCFSQVSNEVQICFNNQEEGIDYVVSVSAVNGAGRGIASGVMSVSTEGVAPPNVPPFTPEQVISTTSATSISLQIPFITTSFLNSDPVNYMIQFQGFLYSDSLLPPSRRRRQSGGTVVAMTDVISVIVPLNQDRTIYLTGLFPNYEYQVNVAIGTQVGVTPSVTIVPSILAAAAPTGSPINLAAAPIATPAGEQQMSLQVSFSNDFSTINGVLRSFNIFYSSAVDPERKFQHYPSNAGPYDVIISDLLPNRDYSVSVEVVTEQGTSSRSTSIHATTYQIIHLTSLVVSLYDTHYFLEWVLSAKPLRDVRFTVKITEQTAATEPVIVLDLKLICNVTCQEDKRVFFQLTDIDVQSLYLVKVTIDGVFGQSSRVYIFDPRTATSTTNPNSNSNSNSNSNAVIPVESSLGIIISMALILVLLILLDIFDVQGL